MQRRQLLKFGLSGFASLSLSGLMRLRAQAAAPGSERTAIILVWLRGGCSHLDTWDPKPDASSDFRSPYTPINTNVPGTIVTELLPRISQIADRFNLLRSVAHTGGGHPAGSLQVLAGDPAAQDKTKPVLPDWMSIANFLRYDPARKLPNYITVNPVDRYDSFTIAGATYLGPSYEPFRVTGDPSQPNFEVPNVGLKDEKLAARLSSRVSLREKLDGLRRDIDATGELAALDNFDKAAVNLLTSPQARLAFDLAQEPDALRDRYGRNQWGQQCLMARRLVEAGVPIVQVCCSAGDLNGGAGDMWDTHGDNFNRLKNRLLPVFDRGFSSLLIDLENRGMLDETLVVMLTDFGRTPKINGNAGRDHYPSVYSLVMAGGGIQGGQVYGSSDSKGAVPHDRPCRPEDIHATIYDCLGISPRTEIHDVLDRPFPVSHGKILPLT